MPMSVCPAVSVRCAPIADYSHRIWAGGLLCAQSIQIWLTSGRGNAVNLLLKSATTSRDPSRPGASSDRLPVSGPGQSWKTAEVAIVALTQLK